MFNALKPNNQYDFFDTLIGIYLFFLHTQFSSDDLLEDNKFLLLSSAERALSLFTCLSVLVGEACVELE